MKKPTAFQQAAYRIFADLRLLLHELHRLHVVVSWQRRELDRLTVSKKKSRRKKR
jgi:hypothetical protein